MAKRVSSLSVNLVVDSSGVVRGVGVAVGGLDKLEREAREAQGSLDKMSKQLSGIGAKLKSFGSAMARAASTFNVIEGAARSVAAVFAPLIDTIEKADEIGKLSREIGASVEFVSGLAFAFEQLGVASSDTLQGLQRFARTLGQADFSDADRAAGRAGEFLELWNISLQDLQRSGADQAVLTILEQIRQLPNAFDQAAAAQAFFGRSGQEIARAAQISNEELSALLAQAEALGRVFGDDLADASAAAADALNRLSSSWEGLKLAIVGALAEPATEFIDEITVTVVALGRFIRDNGDLIQQFFRNLLDAVSLLVKVVAALIIKLDKLAKIEGGGPRLTLKEDAENAEGLAESINNLFPDLKRLQDEIAAAFKAGEDGGSGRSMAELMEESRRLAEERQRVEKERKAAEDAARKAAEAMAKATKARIAEGRQIIGGRLRTAFGAAFGRPDEPAANVGGTIGAVQSNTVAGFSFAARSIQEQKSIQAKMLLEEKKTAESVDAIRALMVQAGIGLGPAIGTVGAF